MPEFVANARHGEEWFGVPPVDAKNKGHAAKKLRKEARRIRNLEPWAYIELDEILEVLDFPKSIQFSIQPSIKRQTQLNLFY